MPAPPKPGRGATVAAAFILLLFALPFCGFGLAAFVKGLREVSSGGSSQYWGMMMIGLVFSVIGFAFFYAVIKGPSAAKKIDRRRAENPDQPWLWRDDWARGRAVSQTKSSMTSAWIWAVLWNMLSLPCVLLIPREQLFTVRMLGVLVFPAVGIGFLIWAIRETLRWMEFGRTYFELSTVPSIPGGELRGTIQTRFPHVPDHGIRLKLSCVNHIVSGSGDGRSSQDKIISRLEKVIPRSQIYPGPSGAAIPVSFHLPTDVPETDGSNSSNSIRWLLEADADVPGVNYKDIFELPVFRTKDAPSAQDVEEFVESEPAMERPAKLSIRVNTVPDGGTEFYFRAGRNVVFAAGTTVFALIWAGAIWLMATHGAPMFFTVIFSLFWPLIGYMSLEFWLGTSRVRIGNGIVKLQSGWLGGGRVQEFLFSDVLQIKTKINGQTGGASGTPYYDIEMTRRNGPPVTLGKTVRDQQEVNWLVSEMTRLIGLKARSVAVTQ
jgi:hypothetical protein